VNIFVLDNDPVKAARDMCNKHVVKMIVESAQILSTVRRLKFSEHFNIPDEPSFFPKLYKATHIHHPAVKWVAESVHNTEWLYKHLFALEEQYRLRYHKFHKTSNVIEELEQVKLAIWGESIVTASGDWHLHTPFVQCMPEEYRSIDPIASYRAFYIAKKAKFAKWAPRSEPPRWWPFIEE
jgi:hypothetical protein